MRISDALRDQRPFFSFEFFPPKDDAGSRQLFAAIEALAPLRPAFVSITYGAGGSTRARTVALAKEIQQQIGLTVVAHVTCVGASRAELRALFDDLARAGIENVLALRGDPPPGLGVRNAPRRFRARRRANCDAAPQLRLLHRRGMLSGEASRGANRRTPICSRCGARQEAGADFFVSQLFFDNALFFAFERAARAAGVTRPIAPRADADYELRVRLQRFVAMCGATIPPKLHVELEARQGRRQGRRRLGVAYASMQALELLQAGVPGLHFYTLNRSPATRAIVSAILAASAWRPAARYATAITAP